MARALGTTTGGGVIAVALAKGWLGVMLAVAVVLIFVFLVGWVIKDPDRSERLAALITAWRSGHSGLAAKDRSAVKRGKGP
jgi:hypothetical protein